MQYAIINFATQQTTFYATFAQASAARTATNMMSGKQFVETVNTPGYMSPSSESYWSM